MIVLAGLDDRVPGEALGMCLAPGLDQPWRASVGPGGNSMMPLEGVLTVTS